MLRDFAFDCERPVIADFLQSLQVSLHTDITIAKSDFLAPSLAADFSSRPFGILAVDAPDEVAYLPQCFDRLTCAVKNHIGRIEVDE